QRDPRHARAQEAEHRLPEPLAVGRNGTGSLARSPDLLSGGLVSGCLVPFRRRHPEIRGGRHPRRPDPGDAGAGASAGAGAYRLRHLRRSAAQSGRTAIQRDCGAVGGRFGVASEPGTRKSGRWRGALAGPVQPRKRTPHGHPAARQRCRSSGAGIAATELCGDAGGRRAPVPGIQTNSGASHGDAPVRRDRLGCHVFSAGSFLELPPGSRWSSARLPCLRGESRITMEPLLQQIVEFMQNRPAATRWILVPTLAAGHTLGERLARDGFAWANLRFTTPLALAARIAGPVLGSRGITEMDQGLGPALLLELLLDLPAEVPQYFRKIVDQPGVAEALW